VLMVHPDFVWRVIWSVPARLTPSMTSISPLLGQFGPKSLYQRSSASSFFRRPGNRFEIFGGTRDEARIFWAYQNAGQTPQIEPGMCAISAMKRP
jgi:hypothetical protein